MKRKQLGCTKVEGWFNKDAFLRKKNQKTNASMKYSQELLILLIPMCNNAAET